MVHDGKLLKMWLEKKGISKTDFADEIGRSRNQVYEYFKTPYLQSKTLVLICEYMGVDPPTREAFYKEVGAPMTQSVTHVSPRVRDQFELTINSLENGIKELDKDITRLRVLLDLIS